MPFFKYVKLSIRSFAVALSLAIFVLNAFLALPMNQFATGGKVLGLTTLAQEETATEPDQTLSPTTSPPSASDATADSAPAGVTESKQSDVAQTIVPDASDVFADYHDYVNYDHFLGFTEDWTPADPFYFVKRVEETVRLAFTFDSQAKQEMRLQVAGERLYEMERMVEQGAPASDVLGAAASYQGEMTTVADNLASLQEQGNDVSGTAAIVDREASSHVLVLDEVALQAPEEIGQVMEAARVASEVAVDTIADISGRPPLPEVVIQKIKSLEAQGILTPLEVVTLLGVETRREARTQLRKLTEDRIFPEEDFAALNETAKYYFPDGYVKTLEIRRFVELSDLETEKPDDATLVRVTQFADTYTPGEPVPADLRRWWMPFVRLEELQNTIRPDIIPEDFFRGRPAYKEYYNRVVERVKPTREDMQLVSQLVASNPAILNDPAYERIMSMGQKFGVWDNPDVKTVVPEPKSCPSGYHWVYAPFVSGDGACVKNYEYTGPIYGDAPIQSCPSGYHRSYPDSPCYPDTPAGKRLVDSLPGTESCLLGYHWVPEPNTPSGGYCSPDYSDRGGINIGIWYPPTYCPGDQVFRDGACYPYNKPPKEGCPGSSWWNGEKCVEPKDCGEGQYQDSNGECRSSKDDYYVYSSQCGDLAQPEGCGIGYWDMASCSCRYTSPPGGVDVGTAGCPPGYRGILYGDAIDCVKDNVLGSCSPPPAGCGQGGYWDPGYCTCKYDVDTTVPPSCTEPPGGCGGPGQGGYWDPVGCFCNDPVWTTCTPPPAGCSGGWWDTYSCSCEYGVVPTYSRGTIDCTGANVSCLDGEIWDQAACGCVPVDGTPRQTEVYPGCQPPSEGCASGSWFDYADCYCRRPGDPISTTTYPPPGTGQCQPPSGGCGGPNWYWDGGLCTCRNVNDTYPVGTTYPGSPGSTCQPPSSGCGADSYWDYGSCSCRSGAPIPGDCAGISCSAPGTYLDYSTCTCKTSSSTSYPVPTYGPSGGCANVSADSCPAGSYFDWAYCTCMPSSPSSTDWPTTSGCAWQDCGSSSYWDSASCSCMPMSTTYPSGSGTSGCAWQDCGPQSYWDGGSCSCQPMDTTYTPPATDTPGGGCAPPSSGCGADSYWDGGACACVPSSPTSSDSSATTSTTAEPTPVPTDTSTTAEPTPVPVQGTSIQRGFWQTLWEILFGR